MGTSELSINTIFGIIMVFIGAVAVLVFIVIFLPDVTGSMDGLTEGYPHLESCEGQWVCRELDAYGEEGELVVKLPGEDGYDKCARFCNVGYEDKYEKTGDCINEGMCACKCV